MSATTINYKAVLFYGLIVGALLLAAFYFLGWEPYHGALNSVGAWISARFAGVTGSFNLGSFIQQHGVTIATVGAPLITLAVAAVKSKMNETAAKKAQQLAEESLLNTQTSSSTQIKSLQNNYEAKIAELNLKLKDLDGDTTLATLQQRVSQLSDDKLNLEKQLQLVTTVKSGPTEEKIKELIAQAALQKYK